MSDGPLRPPTPRRPSARTRRLAALLALAPAAAQGAPAEGGAAEFPQETPTPVPTPRRDAAPGTGVVVVEGHALTGSATDRILTQVDVVAFPKRSTDELLRAAPGLHQSAHGGRGKAYQYFLRGFDAVHGADIAGFVEGIPVNEVSNVHGNGYLDLQMIPTALVSSVELTKGSYRADVGDFDLAASADFSLGLSDPGLTAELLAGTDRGGGALLTWRPAQGTAGDFVVAQVEGGLGVGEGRAFRQVRGAGGKAWETARGSFRAFVLLYDGAFQSPGVLREDDLEDGTVGFYDAYPEHGGGRSSRALGGLVVEGAQGALGWRTTAWAGARHLRLSHNFTGYWFDAIHGDGIRQTHDAVSLGLRQMGYAPLPVLETGALRAGIDLRLELLTQTEGGALPSGEVWEARIDASAAQLDAGAWAEAAGRPAPWVHLRLGGRVDRLQALLYRRIEGGEAVADPAPALSGATVVSPKLAAVLWPDGRVRLQAAWGRGFRSPEVRGLEDGGVAPVATADTGELGVAAAALPSLDLSAAAFATLISDEIVFDHAAGRFLASGETRRLGGELSGRWRPVEALRLDADVTYADGRYVATGEAIPYAPRWLITTGLSTAAAPALGWRWTAGVRGTWLGRRPLPDGFVSHGSFVVGLTARGTRGPWLIDVGGDNLTARHWRDGEFVYPSWFDTATARSELPALHITAGDPFAVRVGVGRRF